MKNVLVTGADGFIGSHLCELLVSRGFSVRALVAYNFRGSNGWLDSVGIKHQLQIVPGDVRDPYFCESLVDGIDTVFHLAALIGIPYSYSAPDSYIQTNVIGTHNICRACLKSTVKTLVVTSTSEVYGTAKYVPIDEDHPLQAQSPYSASKIAADAVALSYHMSFNLPVVIARPFNTFGPRQSSRAIIPTIISQLLDSGRLRLGDLTPTRDLNYVTDTCAGFLALVGNEKLLGQCVNICSNTEVSMSAVVERLGRIIGVEPTAELDPQRIRPERSEVKRLWGDNSKLLSFTGHQNSVSLDEGLRATVDWFKGLRDKAAYDAKRYYV